MVAITYFSLAVTCRYIYERFSDKQYFNIISIIIFITTSIIFFIQPILLPREVFLFLQWIILPISALYSLIVLVSKVKNICIKKILEWFGQESLPVYMIHVFVYNALFIAVQKFAMPLDIITGTVTFVLTIALTALIIFTTKRWHLYNLLFK